MFRFHASPAPVPSASRPWPAWVIILPFLFVAVAVVAVQQWRRPMPPRDLTELAERIKAKHPEWRIMPVRGDESFDGGFFVCREARPRGELIELPRDPEHMKGIARVMAGDKNPDITPALRGNARVVSDVLIYGDAEMVGGIEELLRD